MASTRPTPDFDDELLSAYVDNELTPTERAGVEERLRTDVRAQQVVAELRRASEAVKSLPRVPLGRDLSSSVLAAIEHRAPAADAPNILSLPDRSADHAAGRKRGLIWTALAVAAALMLMALRPGAQLGDQRPVAQTSTPRDGQLAKDDRTGVGQERDQSIGDAARPAATGEVASATGRAPKAPTSAASPSAQVEQSSAARPRGDTDAPAPPAMSRAASGAGRGAGTAPSHEAGEPLAADPDAAEGAVADIADEAADRFSSVPELRTIEIVVTGDSADAAFERLLAEHQITMSAEDLSAEQAAAWGVPRELMPAEGRDAGDYEFVLVEATPAAIESLVASLETRADGSLTFSDDANKTLAAANAGGEADQLSAAGNKAWRVRDLAASVEGTPQLDAADALSEPAAVAPGHERVLLILRPAR